MLRRIRRSLVLKLIFASAVPSACVFLVGLSALLVHVNPLSRLSPGAAFAELKSGAILGSVLALGFAAVSISLAARRFLLAPFQALTQVMARAEKGEYLVRAKVESDDELGRLARSFNTMLARITDMAVHEIETRDSLAQMDREIALRRELQGANGRLAGNLREMELLLEVTRAMSSTLELPEQLAQLGEQLCLRLQISEFSVLLLDEPSHQLVVEAVAGAAPEGARGLRFHIGEGITGQVAAQGETIYVPDVEQDERYLHYKGKQLGHGSFLAVPLKTKGRLLGVMNLSRSEVSAFTAQEIRLAEALAAQAALAIANARLYAQTLELSYTDPLTGIPNRRQLVQRLEQEWTRALRFGDELSLLMIDLDLFKSINDQHGHPVGDAVLRSVALVLRHNVRKVDMVARYGGEEFSVVLPRVAKAEALEVAEKLRRAVAAATLPGPAGAALRLTASVGVASYAQDATDVAGLVERADAALYEAKRAGRDRVVSAPALVRAAG